MKTEGQALADIRRAIVAGFQPDDLQLAVNEASIGKLWSQITYNIQGLDLCVDATIRYAAQQGKLTGLLTTLADKYNPALGPELSQLASELRPLAENATSFGVELEELESIVLGDVEFEDVGIWLDRLASVRRAVCRIEPQPAEQSIAGFGTGFLVEPDVVMTCYHVASPFWKDDMAADRVVFRFDYERRADNSINAGEEYKLAEDWRIHTMAVPDFAVVRVRPANSGAAEVRKPIGISSAAVRTDRPLMILQHPAGEPLKLLFGEVAGVVDEVVTYKINTEGGSSGSPCLASDLRATAVHFAPGNFAYSMRAICVEIEHALQQDKFSPENRESLARLTLNVNQKEKAIDPWTISTEPLANNASTTDASAVDCRWHPAKAQGSISHPKPGMPGTTRDELALTEQAFREFLPRLDSGSWARFLAAVPGASASAGDGPVAKQARNVIEWSDGPLGPPMAELIQTYARLFGLDERS